MVKPFLFYLLPRQSLLENAYVIILARLLASSSTESAAWLAALPVSTFGNLLDDASLGQRKYELLEDRFIVQPVGFETLGSWGPAARTFLSDIGRRIEQATGRERSSEFLRQRISMEIQRGNAASVMGTAETSKDWDKYFFLLS